MIPTSSIPSRVPQTHGVGGATPPPVTAPLPDSGRKKKQVLIGTSATSKDQLKGTFNVRHD